MKISFDVDNVLTHHWVFFQILTEKLKSWGHTVGVVSGRSPETIPPGPWDFIVGCPMGASYKDEHEKNRDWKAKAIKENEIDLHFDDMADWIMEGDYGKAKIINVK